MGTITIQYSDDGELLWIDMGKGKLTEPTHDLNDINNLPNGQNQGFTSLGRLVTYLTPDGRLMRCVKRRCKIF